MNQETCWTLIEGAAAGETVARDDFVRRYFLVIRAYLAARWRGGPLTEEIDDTVQEVFVHCFCDGGALERVDPSRGSGFRAFLYGVVRRTALAVETDRARQHRRRKDGTFHPEQVVADDTSASRVFDRAWARAVIQEAGELHLARARQNGREHLRRVEILRLRFREGLPIRAIAERLADDATHVHHEYARARREFREALRDVVSAQQRCSDEALDRECDRLLALLR